MPTNSLMMSTTNLMDKDDKKDLLDKSIKDVHGRTPLNEAARRGYLEFFEFLLENGANIESECTPLHWATRRGYLDFVKFLLENGANIESKDGRGCTPPPLGYQA